MKLLDQRTWAARPIDRPSQLAPRRLSAAVAAGAPRAQLQQQCPQQRVWQQHCMWQLPARRAQVVAVAARGGRRGGSGQHEQHDFRLDDFVSFDSEDEWEPQGTRVTPSARPFVGQLFGAVSIVVDRLTDLAYTFVPQGVSVRVVRTAVSGSLILMVLAFAKSVLGFLLTLGTLVLGAYIAVRLLGVDLAGVEQGEPEVFKEAHSRKRPGQRPRTVRGRQSEFKGLLSGSADDEEGLLDVWFERNKDKYRRK